MLGTTGVLLAGLAVICVMLEATCPAGSRCSKTNGIGAKGSVTSLLTYK